MERSDSSPQSSLPASIERTPPQPPASSFTTTESLTKDEIKAIVAEAVTAALAGNISPPGPPGPQGPPAASNGNNGANGWRIEDLGYFNPDLPDPADTPVKTISSHAYYRDVYVFVEHLKDLQAINGEELVRSNIHASLRGTALDWYTVELTEFERRSLRRLPLSDGWYAVLVARFRLRASQALNKLRDLSYGPEEVLKGKSARAFAQTVFRYSQAAGLSSQNNQLTQAWTKLHPNLRRNIPEPKETTEVAEFLAHLEAKEDI